MEEWEYGMDTTNVGRSLKRVGKAGGNNAKDVG
jgi:hypothetical protein